MEEGLGRGIINYSGLAREMRPVIEKRLLKTIQRGAIVMALKRSAHEIKKRNKAVKAFYNLIDLTVRSRLCEFTFANSETISDKQKKLFEKSLKKNNTFCNPSQGVRETTIIIDSEASQALEKLFSGEKLLTKINNLSSITIRFHEKIINTPGIYYTLLKLLAWENITLVEVVSTATELTIVFKESDVSQAFSILSTID